MKCPKCNSDIDDKMLVCPHCRKVLKLVCPKCNTINQGNVCKKCGFTIISKCHDCGKINQTVSGKCAKCGLSTYKSIAISNSNIDEFAALVLKFPNLDELKMVLASTKLYEKFKLNLDKLIFDFARERELSREVIDDSYVIKFNKDFSYPASANSALQGAIELLNSLTELNFKLNKAKDTTLQCNIAVLKRDISSLPEDYNSGFDIKLIYQDKKQSKLLNGLQVITDSDIYERVADNYELSTLSSTFVKNKTVTFFELNIKKYVKIPVEEEIAEDSGLAQLPVFDEDLYAQNDLYDVDALNLEELKFNFESVESHNLVSKLVLKLLENPSSIVSVKSGYQFFPRTSELISKITDTKKYSNVFGVTCSDSLKYEPYGFFKELIQNVCNFSKASKNFYLHSFDMFKDIDPSGYIVNLMNSKIRDSSIPEETRYFMFDIFSNVLSTLKGSLIYIEDFSNIDDSSYEILQMFFEKFEEMGISFLIMTDRDFSLHKNSHFLLSNKYYTEFLVMPSDINDIIALNSKYYAAVIKSHYIQKLAQNFKGSYLYFNLAMDYLIESAAFVVGNDGALELGDSKNIFLPPKFDELIVKKLNLLSSNDEALFALYIKLLLIGQRIDFALISLLDIPDVMPMLQLLAKSKFISITKNAIYINNYGLYAKNFYQAVSKELLVQSCNDLLSKLFAENAPTVIQALMLRIIQNKDDEFLLWKKLSKLNSSLGDFSAYLNCCNNFLKIDSSAPDDNDEYQAEIYQNVSNLLYKYSPEKLSGMVQNILDDLKKTEDNNKIVELCNKMLQGYLMSGSYKNALDAIVKITSNFSNMSIDPQSEDFNIAFFFISLIKIEILFSIGSFKDCIEASDEILRVITPDNFRQLKPVHLNTEQFEDIIFDAMYFAISARILLLSNDTNTFIELVKTKLGRVPQGYNLFESLRTVLSGGVVDNLSEAFDVDEDRFSKALYYIILAFNNYKDDYQKFANIIYQAKINARVNRLFQIELACDLLMGFAYFRLGKNIKSSKIYNNVLETAEKNGLKFITTIAWYLISLQKFEEENFKIAFGVANNALIQLEKDETSNELFFFLFKFILYKILLSQGDESSAILCLNNAKMIKDKFSLNYDLDFVLPQKFNQKSDKIDVVESKTDNTVEVEESIEKEIEKN